MSHIPYDAYRAAGTPAREITLSVSAPLVRALLSLAMVTLLFANLNGYIVVAQVVAFAFVAIAAITCLVQGRFRSSGFSFFEFGMAVCAALSLIVSVGYGEDYAGWYTVMFSFVVFSAGIIVRSIPQKDLLNAAVHAYLFMVILVFAFHMRPLATALNMHAADRWLLRISPFGMHPNLTGFVFGAGVIILAYGAMSRSGLARAVYGLTCLGSLAIVLAASARASLLAVAASALLIYAFNFLKMPKSVRIVSATFGVIAVALIVIYPPVIQYLTTVLELDSNTRGVNSGGSGRTDIWQQGIEYIISSPATMFFGGGLRSASAERIGFYTESSYINIFIESGFFCGSLLICLFLGSAFLFQSNQTRFDITKLTLSWIITFALVQSIFNRYLLGIGNSFSLMLIFLYASAWCSLAEARAQYKSRRRSVS